MAPSIASPSPSIPCKASYAARPLFHKARNTPAAAHSWTRRWAELLEQMAVGFRAFHWHPVRSTKKMASMAWRSSTRGRGHPSGCSFRGGSSGWMCSHNSSGMRQSRRTCSWSVFIEQAPVAEWQRIFADRIPSKQPTGIGPKSAARAPFMGILVIHGNIRVKPFSTTATRAPTTSHVRGVR
jgi:hypothetical protein